MRKTGFLILSCLISIIACCQNTFPPQKIYGELFEDVQLSGLLPTSAAFANAEAKRNPKSIVADYLKTINNPNIRFSLKLFLEENFTLPVPVVMNGFDGPVSVESLSKEWPKLFKMSTGTSAKSSGIALPFPYVIPGGYLGQMQYEDAYFLMLGLLESGNTTMVENMVSNFSYLITQFGFIPKGNRTYFLSRSQLPYFSLMLDLLAEYQGNKVYALYQSSLQKEYDYWMDSSRNHLVEMPDGTKLNRFFDQSDLPMDEDYANNLKWTSGIRDQKKASAVYRNLRSADGSGWYLSSRWIDGREPANIRTGSIVPVDLNSFILHLEETLSKAYKERGDLVRMRYYSQLAEKRKQAIQKYFFNKEAHWYCDYDLDRKQASAKKTLAGLAPMFFELPSKNTAKQILEVLMRDFLRPGGLQATMENSGFLYDAPNGFASHQYLAIESLKIYDFTEESETVATRWINNNVRQLEKTGKLFGYYPVSEAGESGKSSAFNEDGYGVTLGVLIRLLKDYPVE